MKLYVASSWRCLRQPEIVGRLREVGHDVYDFRNAPGGTGFGWRQCAEEADLKDPRAFRDKVLAHPRARAGFESDMGALRDCDACVLVLPCGRSAHLELGWACGARKRTIVLLTDPLDEPELMYLMLGSICVDLDEVVAELALPRMSPGEDPSRTRGCRRSSGKYWCTAGTGDCSGARIPDGSPMFLTGRAGEVLCAAHDPDDAGPVPS